MNKNIDLLVSWLSELKDYVEGQAPDVVNQLINYTLYIDKRICLVCTLIIAFLWILAILDLAKLILANGAMVTIAIVISIVLGIFSMVTWAEIQRIKRAPKVFVLEYVTHQIEKITGDR